MVTGFVDTIIDLDVEGLHMMRHPDEIDDEITRVKNNPYADFDVPSEDNLDTTAYIAGLRFALGNDVDPHTPASPDTVAAIIERGQRELDVEQLTIERNGRFPHDMRTCVRAQVSLDAEAVDAAVDEYQAICDDLEAIVREEEGDGEMIYTTVERV